MALRTAAARFSITWGTARSPTSHGVMSSTWSSVRAMEKSDSLLMFLLKARRPHVYRERAAHEGSSPVVVTVRKDFAD
jgi:hypothetical protein